MSDLISILEKYLRIREDETFHAISTMFHNEEQEIVKSNKVIEKYDIKIFFTFIYFVYFQLIQIMKIFRTQFQSKKFDRSNGKDVVNVKAVDVAVVEGRNR
jgi:hypothetical protein